jgi:eukaryotic-like serine/threonine-protein kinase
VGSPGTLSGFGTTDMAGNVKEWCLNEGRDGERFILGGGFGDPPYMFINALVDEQDPWHRDANFGFRGVKLDAPPSPAASAKIEIASRDFRTEKPVSDDVSDAYVRLYAYDHRELHARTEETETAEGWTREKVSFDAAYGNERMTAHLLLPRNVSPPFQTVVFFPNAYALMEDRIDLASAEEQLGFLTKSGWALMLPTYKGMYQRRDGFNPYLPFQTAIYRDHVIMWSKDLGRALDYLQQRKDIDATKLAFVGFSLGASLGPVFLAVETRFRAAILSSGGLLLERSLPEVDAFNFVTHVKIPVLMLNGRYDAFYPVESSQLPLFRLLRTPDRDKKHVLYDGIHALLPHAEEVRESLDWLDKYLGPVR